MFEEFWWIIPLGMMIFCLFMMRSAKGTHMCGFGSHNTEQNFNKSDTAMEILEKRYALGEINREEYEEKRKELNQTG